MLVVKFSNLYRYTNTTAFVVLFSSSRQIREKGVSSTFPSVHCYTIVQSLAALRQKYFLCETNSFQARSQN